MSDESEIPAEHPDEVINTIHTVSDTMDAISKSLEAIAAYGRRTRHISIALIISLILDLVLTAIVGLLSSNAINESDTVKAVQYSGCVADNQMRLDQVHLWTFFINLADPTQQEKQKNAKAINALTGYVGQTFAPQKCY